MGIPSSEVSYTSATTGREDHQVHKRHVVALGKEKKNNTEFCKECVKPTVIKIVQFMRLG
jgi:hypothetical protein